jgi:hypothetical protein
MPRPMTAWRRGVRHSARGGSTALLVVAVVVVVVISSLCYVVLRPQFTHHRPKATSPPFTGQIDILPSAGTPSGCIAGTPGAGVPTKPLVNGTLQANVFNPPASTSGSAGLCYDAGSGAVFNYVNWSQVGAAGGWFSYPQISYGVDRWGGSATTYTGQSAHWNLPQQVGSVVGSNVWGTVTYAYHAPSSSVTRGNDFSFDDFLSQSVPPNFEQGPFVELMVWFDHHNIYPFTFSHWSMPTLVGSTLSTQPWDVGYWCHARQNSSSPTLTFDYSFRGQGSNGMSFGTIGVNLSLILANVEQLMPSVTCWTGPAGGFSQFYLDQVNLGSEDTVNGSVSLDYNWTETSYCYHLLTQPATSGSVSCSTPGASSATRITQAP